MGQILKNRKPLWAVGAVLTLGMVVFIAAPGTGRAQAVTATINGTVADPSGAAVAGAKVTATDTQRGTQYSGTTNSDGRYSIPNLLVGAYDVKVENPGFQTATQSNITLQLNQGCEARFRAAGRQRFHHRRGDGRGAGIADRIDPTRPGD
jgi:hypothetical protein